MLRTDVSFVFYIIQHKQNDGKWVMSSFDYFGMPGDWRHEDSFSANGDCWQTTGVHATFKEDVAKSAVAELSSKHKLTKFRYRKCIVSQSIVAP